MPLCDVTSLMCVMCVGRFLLRAQVIEKEGISCSKDGLEAIVFTADGDMRQALNNLQATHTGFGDVTADSVFKASRAGGMHTHTHRPAAAA